MSDSPLETTSTSNENNNGDADADDDDDVHVEPFFIIVKEVCNVPRSNILHLQATGENLTFTLINDNQQQQPQQQPFVEIKNNNKLELIDTVDFPEATVKIQVKKNVTNDELNNETLKSISLLLPSNDYSEDKLQTKSLTSYIRHDNQIHLKLLFSKSYCPGSDTKTKIIIVTLSVICLLLLTSLTIVLVVLRRKKPYFFSKNDSGQNGHHESCSNQVAPW